jgi:DNA repair protein RecN (Recombination protein N)
MLHSLSIRDFIIVKQLDLEFNAGYTVLTGETGAGKSILIDALSLALGARGEGGICRAGCEKAEISAIFSIQDNLDAQQWMQAAELTEESGELVLRRVMYADGRSRAFINGTTVTVAQLKELGELLLDIYSQNAHHSLLKPITQRNVLDQFAGLSELALQVAEQFKAWHKLNQQRLEAEKNASVYARELAELQETVQVLTDLALTAEDWAQLQQEHLRLSNAADLMSGGAACRDLLSEGEQSAQRLLAKVRYKLENLSEYDGALQEAMETLDSAMIQLVETDRFLNHYLQDAELDPAKLAALDEKIQNVHGLSRKYRVPPESLEALLQQSQTRMDELALYANDDALAKLEAQAWASYQASALQLSAGRQLAARELSEKISAQMQDLSLAGGQFEVALSPQSAAASGLELVEFLVAGHAGVAPRPLNKVASGGELSRISLAIRVVTAHKENVPTMIFDEVDVGIGGGVAEVVGRLLKQLGVPTASQTGQTHARQVLVITHLPQVAALASWHMQVSKSQQDGQTLSHISQLDHEARVEEIARMLGGLAITETTRQHAREMLA